MTKVSYSNITVYAPLQSSYGFLPADETSHISYAVLDKDGETITTITRKFIVSRSVSFIFTPSSIMSDGAVVVVKRSTDPVRTNNASFSIEMSGLAAGAYRLVSDKTKFHLNNMTSLAASLPSGCSGNYEIYGDYPSSSMFDAELSLETVEGTTLCSTNITVLWVDISMRCGQDDDFSQDNNCAIKPDTAKLGRQTVSFYGQPISIGNTVEFVGTVHPSDFPDYVDFNRDNIGVYRAVKTPSNPLNVVDWDDEIPRGAEPLCNDKGDLDYQDRLAGQTGRVFCYDTPGGGLSSSGASNPQGTYFFLRYNFIQYTVWDGKRCSNDFRWHSRTTLIKTSAPGTLSLDFAFRPLHQYDNSCGQGFTRIELDE